MERELSLRLRLVPTSFAVEEGPRSVRSLVLPLVGSLLQTYGAVWLLCGTPWGATLTWASLLVKAISYLLITMAAHVVAVWSNRRLFPQQTDAPARLLLFATWPAVVWLPLLVLLRRESSALMVLVPPVIAASAAVSLRRWIADASGARSDLSEAGDLSSLFHVRQARSLVRGMMPALGASVALEAAMLAFGLGWPFAAGCLLAAGAVLPVWAYSATLKPQGLEGGERSSARAGVRPTLTVLLLLAIALIPYLRQGGGTIAAISALLRAQRSSASAPQLKESASGHAPDGSYSGVILMLPLKPHHEIVPPPLTASIERGRVRRKPLIIPFDGAYWYFKQPDQRPRAGAPVVRGDPRKKSIRSTDARPLSMEAHQRLDRPVNMSCCRLMRLAIQNADNGAGVISVEVLLRDGRSKRAKTQSLGTLVIASSEKPHISPTRPAVDESLSFAFPPHGPGQEFDEITVVIKPARERGRAGARVAVESFELVP